MCLAIPGEVVELLPGNDDQLALVDVVGVKRRINVGLLEDEQEAAEALRMLELMGQSTD